MGGVRCNRWVSLDQMCQEVLRRVTSPRSNETATGAWTMTTHVRCWILGTLEKVILKGVQRIDQHSTLLLVERVLHNDEAVTA